MSKEFDPNNLKDIKELEKFKEKNLKSANKEPDKKEKIKFYILVCSFFALMVIILIVAICLPKNNDDDTENEPQITYTYLDLQETLHFSNGLDITINSFYFTNSFNSIKPSSTTDNILCVVGVKLYNTSTSNISFGSWHSAYDYDLIYDKEYEYLDRWNTAYTAFLRNHDDIKPLSTLTAYICYEVPNVIQTTEKDLEIKFTYMNKKEDVYIWKLRGIESI